MTSRYTTVGPLKDMTAAGIEMVTAAANESHALSSSAVVRRALENEERLDISTSITSGQSAFSAEWESDRDFVDEVRVKAFFGRLIPLAAAGLALSFLALALVSKAWPGMGDIYVYGLFATILSVFALGTAIMTHSDRVTLRQCREFGFHDDYFLRDAAQIGGSVWNTGKHALYIASRERRSDKPGVKVVFYDAIGSTTVEVDESGRESIEITGRDGELIASILAPESNDYPDPHAIALALRQRANAARP
jgi:hypothetical protein